MFYENFWKLYWAATFWKTNGTIFPKMYTANTHKHFIVFRKEFQTKPFSGTYTLSPLQVEDLNPYDLMCRRPKT